MADLASEYSECFHLVLSLIWCHLFEERLVGARFLGAEAAFLYSGSFFLFSI